MNSSPRRERVGPVILRLSTSVRMACSEELLVGGTSGSASKVHSAGSSLSSLAQVLAVRVHWCLRAALQQQAFEAAAQRIELSGAAVLHAPAEEQISGAEQAAAELPGQVRTLTDPGQVVQHV